MSDWPGTAGELLPGTDKVGHAIRSNHPYAYRSGVWGKVEMVIPARGRHCFLVRWHDGATDLWPVDDGDAGYQYGTLYER